MLEIEGFFVDRHGQPLDGCTVEVVAWEGEVLATSTEWADHFKLQIPNITQNTPIFFRIQANNAKATSTHHEIDSPALILPAAEKKVRLLLAAAQPVDGQKSTDLMRPAWVILPFPEKSDRRTI